MLPLLPEGYNGSIVVCGIISCRGFGHLYLGVKFERKNECRRNITMAKPFLKWVGGKTQLLDNVLGLFPSEMNNYHEPFLGGGSVLLGFLTEVREGKKTLHGTVYASDVNPILIALYKHIQGNLEGFIAELQQLDTEFSNLKGTLVNRKPTSVEEAKTSQESYYYWIRAQFNALPDKTTRKASAMMLFLNKTCFRGVYREGPHGFNVPFGHYKNPTIVDEVNLRAVSALIQPVVFRCQGFEHSFQAFQAEDFTYLDPPYAPETDTSFDTYVADGFSKESHLKLFTLCQGLRAKKIGMTLSNANVPFVTNAFPEPPFQLYLVSARRAINSKDPSATTDEVLITNEE